MIIDLDFHEEIITELALVRDYEDRLATRSRMLAYPVLTEEDSERRQGILRSLQGEASVINKLAAARKGVS